jgi:hypothetical protein
VVWGPRCTRVAILSLPVASLVLDCFRLSFQSNITNDILKLWLFFLSQTCTRCPIRHLIASCERSNAAAREVPILDPQNDHISFYSPNLADVIAIIREQEIEYVRQTVEDENVDQVSLRPASSD